MRAIHDTEFPNSVEATQRLLDEQGADYDNLKVDVKNNRENKNLNLNYQILKILGGNCCGSQTWRTVTE